LSAIFQGSGQSKRSYKQHRVAEAEKPVFFFDGLPVNFKHAVFIVKRADKHDQRRFREVEVRNQRVDRLIAESRINKNIRLAAFGFHNAAVALCGAFQRSDDRRTDRDDPLPAAFAALILRAASGVI
jgi:hypothetical protein